MSLLFAACGTSASAQRPSNQSLLPEIATLEGEVVFKEGQFVGVYHKGSQLHVVVRPVRNADGSLDLTFFNGDMTDHQQRQAIAYLIDQATPDLMPFKDESIHEGDLATLQAEREKTTAYEASHAQTKPSSSSTNPLKRIIKSFR